MSTKRLTKYRGAEKRRVPETKPIIRQGRVTHALFKSQMMRCFWPDSLPPPTHTSSLPNEINFLLGRLSYATRIASHVQRRPSYSFPSLVAANYSLSRPPRVFLHLRLGKGCARYSVRIRVGIVAPNSPAATARY